MILNKSKSIEHTALRHSLLVLTMGFTSSQKQSCTSLPKKRKKRKKEEAEEEELHLSRFSFSNTLNNVMMKRVSQLIMIFYSIPF